MSMLILKTNKKFTSCFSNLNEIENLIREKVKNFKQLNDETSELVKRQFLEVDVTLSQKKFKRWISSILFQSSASNKTQKYWILRGYSEEESKDIISSIQVSLTERRSKMISDLKKSNSDEWKKMFNVHLEYYLAKGMTEEEAKEALRSRQKTFSLEKCISKHGETKGKTVWENRQKKWIETLSRKSEKEKMEINKRRCVPLGRASRESLRIFDPITSYLINQKIFENEDIFFGNENRKEWFLYDNRIFLYDFCIPKLKLIIEYQGKKFHPQPSLTIEELENWRSLGTNHDALTVKKADELKRQVAEKNGFVVEYLWAEDGFEFNFKKAKDIIFNALENIGTTREISSIENLVLNDPEIEVLIDTPTGYHRVVNFVNKPIKKTFEIILTNGLSLVCSHDHLVMTNDGWKTVESLSVNNSFKVYTQTGEFEISQIREIGDGYTVDITVECLDNHYYANGITSHNCGKTLLAIAAGLEQLDSIGSEKTYQKMIISRPIQPVGRDIGFLPGTLEEKMEPWIAPIRDNLEYLLGGNKKQNRKKKTDESGGFRDPYLDLMQQKGLIEVEAISFIRGRSIPNAFMIIDEAQNLSMHELKTIVTRAGENTKIVLTGDIEQIDNVHVDTFTNGLTYAIEKFKQYDISGHVTLLKGERSPLASLASQIL